MSERVIVDGVEHELAPHEADFITKNNFVVLAINDKAMLLKYVNGRDRKWEVRTRGEKYLQFHTAEIVESWARDKFEALSTT